MQCVVASATPFCVHALDGDCEFNLDVCGHQSTFIFYDTVFDLD